MALIVGYLPKDCEVDSVPIMGPKMYGSTDGPAAQVVLLNDGGCRTTGCQSGMHSTMDSESPALPWAVVVIEQVRGGESMRPPDEELAKQHGEQEVTAGGEHFVKCDCEELMKHHNEELMQCHDKASGNVTNPIQ
jgi:hypothetical protein